MTTILIIFGMVLSTIIIALIFFEKVKDPFLVYLATGSAWLFILLGVGSIGSKEGYRDGQQDALRGKQMYNMRIIYEQLKDDTYYPVDTLFEEKRYHHKNK